ncbi:MAG TPA: hypothetical protein VIG24_18455 [Acidimicrobiia bacterium]
MAGFYSQGKSGEALFETSDDFEKLKIGDYELTVDFLRNAVRWTARTEEYMGMRGELVNNIPAQLGEWMGRAKCERLFMAFNAKGGSDNYVYANGRGNADELVSADTLDWDEIIVLGKQMERMGGKPALLGKTRNGQPIFRNCVLATSEALTSLEFDSNFKQVLREASQRGASNELYEGGYTDVRGHAIKNYVPIDHDGAGPVGSPINPKAFLGEAIDADNTAPTIKGGRSATEAAYTRVHYFKWFPKYAYEWTPDDTLAIDGSVDTWTDFSSNFYILIVNPPGGANGNKIGMYEVSANSGNQLTVTKRLRAAASGDAVTSLGDVTWDTGVWEGLHTDSHPVGSTIILCNKKGVPLGHTLMMGSGAAMRGYGRYRNRRDAEKLNGNFVMDSYITSVFGQTPRKDTTGRCPAFMHLTHAIQYAGLPIPTNIT